MKHRSISEIFSAFEKLSVLVIGDVMLDNYLWGKVERISPEAPVPIASIQKKESRLGGAANVAINIKALGATPILCSVIGNDINGRSFIELLKQIDLSADGIFQSTERITTVKTRVIGNNHQMLRVDEEQEDDLTPSDRKQLLNRITMIIAKKKIDVIVFEDYDKGVIGKSLIESVVKLARQKGIPIAVDPKKKNFNHYKNVTLFKPNLKELREGMKVDLDKNKIEDISKAVNKLCNDNKIDTALITLSEKGIFYVDEKEEKLLPAHIRTIADVSGAGDTVISVAALCLALDIDTQTLATLSNLAGGLVCEKVGVVPIEKQQLLDEAKRLKLK